MHKTIGEGLEPIDKLVIQDPKARCFAYTKPQCEGQDS